MAGLAWPCATAAEDLAAQPTSSRGRDFATTRGNFEGVLGLEQLRTREPRRGRERARNRAPEVRLP